MRKRKWNAVLAAAAAFTLLLSGCGRKQTDMTVRGTVAIFVQEVALSEDGSSLTVLGPVADAAVIFFSDDRILGQIRTRGDGWTPEVRLTVPYDSRYGLLRRLLDPEGKQKQWEIPGEAHVLVLKEGYRPTILSGLVVQPDTAPAYAVSLMRDGETQSYDVILPAGQPLTESQAIPADHPMTVQLISLIESALQEGQIPLLEP